MEIIKDETGRTGLRWNLHEGQKRTLESTKRFILNTAGWQSGKSEAGCLWLYREMRKCGPGDYLVASPTFPLMSKKVLPIFCKLFERMLRLGKFVSGKNVFTFSNAGCIAMWGAVPDEPARVIFGHAADPDSLESATVKAAWLDEAGQKTFRLPSWEVVLGRLSVHQGRVLLTSRPYDLGWMKQMLWDKWIKANRNHPEIDVINYRSIDNPAFPAEEYYRAKRSMPDWRFLMLYDGLFTRPAGVIYEAFDENVHKIPRFAIPSSWPRYLGLDFGGVNTAGIFFAEECTYDDAALPTGRFFAYREYLAGGRRAAEHCHHLLKGEPGIPFAVGGSKSEDQWRAEFAAGGEVNGEPVPGIPVRNPGETNNDASVEVGINKVIAALQTNKVFFFDDLTKTLDEIGSYSRELDDMGEPTENIADKECFHLLDSIRYVIGWIHPAGGNVDTMPTLEIMGPGDSGGIFMG
jgi:hypothetical protein